MLHSKQYKRPEQLLNKRVLVIGGGNSACDIAVEAGVCVILSAMLNAQCSMLNART